MVDRKLLLLGVFQNVIFELIRDRTLGELYLKRIL